MNSIGRFLKPFIVFCCLVSLFGCINREVDEAAAFAARLVQSNSYEVEVSEQTSELVYDLRISHAKYDSSFSVKDIVSTCALAFFNQLPNHDQSSFVRLTIDDDSSSFQQTYSVEELQSVDRCLDNIYTFFKWHPAMGIDSIRPLLDNRFFPESVVEQMGAIVLKQDSLDNAFQRCEFHGFEMDTVAQIPVIILKVDALRKQAKNSYKAFLSIQNEKILWLLQTDL